MRAVGIFKTPKALGLADLASRGCVASAMRNIRRRRDAPGAAPLVCSYMRNSQVDRIDGVDYQRSVPCVLLLCIERRYSRPTWELKIASRDLLLKFGLVLGFCAESTPALASADVLVPSGTREGNSSTSSLESEVFASGRVHMTCAGPREEGSGLWLGDCCR